MDKFDAIITDLKNNKQPIINLCDCYREREERHYFTDFEQGMRFAEGLLNKEYEIRKVPYCVGTKECEICRCGGNRTECDFYDEVRKKAKSKQKKADKLNQILENISMIVDIGFDYDGFEKSEDLKELIDELVDYARKARRTLREYMKEAKNNE